MKVIWSDRALRSLAQMHARISDQSSEEEANRDLLTGRFNDATNWRASRDWGAKSVIIIGLTFANSSNLLTE